MAKQATGISTVLNRDNALKAIKELRNLGGLPEKTYLAVSKIHHAASETDLVSKYDIGGHIEKLLEDVKHGENGAGLIAQALQLDINLLYSNRKYVEIWPVKADFIALVRTRSKADQILTASHLDIFTECDEKLRANFLKRFIKESTSARDMRALKVEAQGGVTSNNPAGRGGKIKSPTVAIGKLAEVTEKYVDKADEYTIAYGLIDAKLEESDQTLLDTIDKAIDQVAGAIEMLNSQMRKLEESKNAVTEELQRQEQAEQQEKLVKASSASKPKLKLTKKAAVAEKPVPSLKKKVKKKAVVASTNGNGHPVKKKKVSVAIPAADEVEDEDID